ncbi:MAG: dihydrodipicolinate synthase family protein [Planctomycetota bacterium]|jgi:4-hydroxy-tetrahydrodipicolinate synthase
MMAKENQYHGVVVPMVTPFTDSGQIDIEAAKRVTEHIVAGGACAFVLGTTGEAASVPQEGRPAFVEAAIKQTAGRALTYAGIAGNCFKTSADAAKKYFDLGIDAVVANLPSYYPLTADHMLKYYEALADSVPGPLIVYNITITTHMSIPLDVVEKLSHHPNIVGLKDSEKNEERFKEAIGMWKDRADFAHFTGSAALSTMALLLGSDGIVPSTGNFTPKIYRDLYEAAIAGDADKANELQEKTNGLGRIYQKDRVLSQSLAALKVIMNELGLCGEAVLPPLVRTGAAEKADILHKLAKAGISK